MLDWFLMDVEWDNYFTESVILDVLSRYELDEYDLILKEE